MSQWYCHARGQQYGPVDKDVLQMWVRQGRVGPNDYVWTAGLTAWLPVHQALPDLFPETVGVPSALSMVPAARPGGSGGATPNGQLTAQARQFLHGRWGLPIGFCLLLTLISVAASNVPFLGGFASLIIAGPLQLGGVIFFLTLTRGGSPELGMLFAGFKNFGNALGAYLLISLFVLLWSLAAGLPGGILAIVIGVAAAKSGGGDYGIVVGFFAAAFLSLIPAMTAGAIAALSYSQTFYLIADDRTLGPLTAIRKSKQVMDGFKEKLAWLWLRFFGWSLVCILTLGIGLLWLWPYMGTTYARFYDDLQPSAAPASETPIEPDSSSGAG